MELTSILALVIFSISAVAHLVNDLVENKNYKLIKAVSKSLLMPTLIIFYAFYTLDIDPFIIIGLVFGWFGDIFLLNKGDKKKFIMGLGSFLLGHIFYIVAFLLQVNFSEAFSIGLMVYLGLIAVFIVVLIMQLKEGLGKMKGPVIAYCVVISFMSISAFLLATSPAYTFALRNGYIVFSGSILFIISDALIAWRQFKKEIKFHNIYVMATYIVAQFLIAYGFIVTL